MRQLILGTAGHIDHGKTALVRALTGTDTDRLPEEKKRGITIDLGFAELVLGGDDEGEGFDLGIVDVPGHERFVRNMLAGAAGVDLALFVVAADDSVMPQTREHLAILELLGVQRGVIALTKCDLGEDGDWADLVEDEVRELVEGTFLEGAAIVRTSAKKGMGLAELRSALLEVCRAVPIGEVVEPFRLAVDHAFVKEGLGTIVTGTVWSGRAAVGDELELLPEGKRVRIRGLQSHGREAIEIAVGQRAAIQLANVHHTEVGRGDELVAIGVLTASRILTVKLRVLPESPLAIKHRSRVRLHIGAREVTATVSLLRAGNRLEPGEADGGVEAQLFCGGAEGVVARNGQAFVVRSESPVFTLGGGTVLQPMAGRRLSRRNAGEIDRLADLGADDAELRVAGAVYFLQDGEWEIGDLWRLANVELEEGAKIVTELVADGVLVEMISGGATRCLHGDVVARIEGRILRALIEAHEAEGLASGVPIGRVLQRLEYLDSSVVRLVVERMVEAERIVGVGDEAIAHPDFVVKLSAVQKRMRAELPGVFEVAGFGPPSCKELAGQFGTTEGEVKPVLDLLSSGGDGEVLVHVGGGMFLHVGCWRRMIELVGGKLNDEDGGDGITVGDVREVLGTSRKFAIPFCEHLDRIGFTKRRSDVRVSGARREEVERRAAGER